MFVLPDATGVLEADEAVLRARATRLPGIYFLVVEEEVACPCSAHESIQRTCSATIAPTLCFYRKVDFNINLVDGKQTSAAAAPNVI